MQDAWYGVNDCLDCTEIDSDELSYEVQGIEKPTRAIVARSCLGTITDSFYCDMCFSTQDCFGCFGLKTLLTKDLPKTNTETNENITEEIIQCSSQNSSVKKDKYTLCTTAFNLTSLELTLYKKMKIPVPEKCFPCRRQDRFALRNPRKLWHRQCMCEKGNIITIKKNVK